MEVEHLRRIRAVVRLGPCVASVPTGSCSNVADAIRSDEPDLRSWLRASRPDLARGLDDNRSEPRVRSASARLSRHRDAAIGDPEQLPEQRLEQRPAPGPARAA